MTGQVSVLCAIFIHTYLHAFIPTLLWKEKKKTKPQTTARGDCANLLLTCGNELPRLITWQRLDCSCQLRVRIVCQRETKLETYWKSFLYRLLLFLFFSFSFLLLRISPLLLSLTVCLAAIPRCTGTCLCWDKLCRDMEQDCCQPQSHTILTESGIAVKWLQC